MTEAETSQLLDKINEALHEDIQYITAPTILYIEVGDRWVSASIFKDLGTHILSRVEGVSNVGSVVLELWKPAAGDTGAAIIEYLVQDGRFELVLTPRAEHDLYDSSFERREQAIARHFGTKPIVYPPVPLDDFPTYEF